MKVVGAAALAAFVLAGASASAAERAFPGRNGSIVFVSDRTSPREPEIYAVGIDGLGRRNLTRTAGWDSRPLASPDATRILFQSVHEGRPAVFVMNSDGSGRRFLTGGANAVWAPDSRRIAFENCCGWVAVLDLDTGEARLLKQGGLPAWSPDGTRIAFVGMGFGPELRVVGADGSGDERLAAGIVLAGVTAFAPAWSPDGSRIAIAGDAPDSNRIAVSSDLWVVRADNGVPHALGVGPDASAPRWSPDGRTLVYVHRPVRESGSELRVVEADGGTPRTVTRPPRLTYDLAPAWSPDGAWIAFGRGPDREIPSDVFVVRSDGSDLRRLTPPWVKGVPFEAPEWSSDGRTIFYASASADTDPDLFTVRPDGAGLRRLTNDREVQSEPAWSPDGSRIAFVHLHLSGASGRPTFNEEIYVARADGTGARRLTRRAGEDLSPSWSPDGSRIVFVRRVRTRGTLAIYTMRAEGGGVRRLTAREGFYSSPAWAPDGRRIAFTAGSGVGEGGDLYVMVADGSRARRLVEEPTIWSHPRWSPDGRLLAVIGATNCGAGCDSLGVYVVSVERGGGRPISDDGGRGLAWSPDGAEIAVGRGSINVIAADGGDVRKVTPPGADDVMPDWAPRCSRSGTARGDRLVGSGSDDLLCGQGGRDVISGGSGRDRLFGAEGDDVIHARDGTFDVVGCGPGFDTVFSDRRDLVGEDCERVSPR